MEEQNDFDKLFGSNLPNFADKDWRNLEGQLERHDLKKQFTRLLWALPTLGGVFMAISGMLYYQLNQTRQQVRTLEDKLVSAYEKRPAQPEISPQKIIIHDTVYRQVVVRQIIREIQPFNSNITNNPENDNIPKYDNTYTENQVVSEREKFIGIHNLTSKSPILSTTDKGITNDFSKLNPVIVPEDSFVTENHFSLIPKSISVGILGGIQKPVGDDFMNDGGREIGLRTVLGYHNSKGQERWGIVLDFQQSAMFFDRDGRKLDKYQKDKIEKLITPPSPRPNGTIRELNRIEHPIHSAFQVGVGLRYNLLFSEKIKPYFGANWNIKIPYQYNKQVYYEDLNDPLTAPSEASTINMLGINSGVNILLSKKLSLNSEVYFHSQLTKNQNTDNEASSVLGGRVGVSYRFGR
jgi:hypothetical protein